VTRAEFLDCMNTSAYSLLALTRALIRARVLGLGDAVAASAARAPLGNADPDSLGREVAHLLHPALRVTGEVRHVDGGYHVLG